MARGAGDATRGWGVECLVKLVVAILEPSTAGDVFRTGVIEGDDAVEDDARLLSSLEDADGGARGAAWEGEGDCSMA